MTHFHLMRTQKHRILTIVVLNMAKYTIISLILTDFVPIFFILHLFEFLLGGHSVLKKSQVQKVPTPLGGGGGGHPHFGPFPKFPCFLVWKASLSKNS